MKDRFASMLETAIGYKLFVLAVITLSLFYSALLALWIWLISDAISGWVVALFIFLFLLYMVIFAGSYSAADVLKVAGKIDDLEDE